MFFEVWMKIDQKDEREKASDIIFRGACANGISWVPYRFSSSPFKTILVVGV